MTGMYSKISRNFLPTEYSVPSMSDSDTFIVHTVSKIELKFVICDYVSKIESGKSCNLFEISIFSFSGSSDSIELLDIF